MDSLRVYDGPAFGDPSEVSSARYGREPLVRVALPGQPGLLALACRDGTGLAGAGGAALGFLAQAVAVAFERR